MVHASWRDLANLAKNRDVVVATDHKYEELRTEKVRFAAIFFAMALALFFITDKLSISLYAGALGMVLSGVLTIDEAYEACLLYTSPSPRDATLSRMPSSA